MNKHPLTRNKKTGLLELSEHTYELRDVKEPELYRGIFDFGKVPKVIFNKRQVPMNTPEEFWITDTTFRDGQQSAAPYTVEQIVTLYKLLARLGGKKGIVRQSEFFLYSEKDRKAVEACKQENLKFPEITAWIRANPADFELVKQMEIKETGILVSCSDYHIFNKMKLTRKQAVEKYLAVVKAALAQNIIPRCHFEDITRADFYGFVVPFAYELMKLAREAKIPIKIRACDTLGYGVSYIGSALPRSVPGIIYGLNYFAEVPSAQLEWHGHNDFYKVVTNAATAWLYGCSSVNCSLLGIGERTGNCPTEAMCLEYAQLKGTTNGMDFKAISEIADYFEKEMGYTIPPQTPFAGRNFNSTRAGIHADGMLKNPEIYNIFDTEKILGRAPTVAVSDTSGLAGITFWLNQYYRLGEESPIQKTDPIVAKVKDAVDKAYASGRTTVMTDAELDEMVKSADKKQHKMLRTGVWAT
ncbi:MAG: 2-isopropylmalate synthase [Firmicutes bacterium]|nr:2-isopropylmalate synthase [Bacillota bacterium]